ncbi:MAG: hypothetical protein ACYCQI_14060 [Gammaproteobacteria bacterium]
MNYINTNVMANPSTRYSIGGNLFDAIDDVFKRLKLSCPSRDATFASIIDLLKEKKYELLNQVDAEEKSNNNFKKKSKR